MRLISGNKSVSGIIHAVLIPMLSAAAVLTKDFALDDKPADAQSDDGFAAKEECLAG